MYHVFHTPFKLVFALSAMGILLATRIKSIEAHQGVIQLLMFPMIFLSGVFFPVNNLPDWMSVLVKINPVTYAVDPIRQLMLGSEASSALAITVFGHRMTIGEDLLIVAAFGVVMVILAMWSFGTQEQKRGTSRLYSAIQVPLPHLPSAD